MKVDVFFSFLLLLLLLLLLSFFFFLNQFVIHFKVLKRKIIITETQGSHDVGLCALVGFVGCISGPWVYFLVFLFRFFCGFFLGVIFRLLGFRFCECCWVFAG
jgi:hypothetical protein